MARLIEIQDVAACDAPVKVGVGDVLVLRAIGARIESGSDAVHVIGTFTAALLGDNGEVLAAVGSPATVLLEARQIGDALVTVFGGDPFHSPRTTTLRIAVLVVP